MTHTNVLVATDFSKRSFDVIQKAYAFAKTNHAALHVVHAVEEGFFTKIINLEEIKQNSFTALSEQFPFLEKENFHCEKGKAEQVVANTANALNASVVFMGSSGEKDGIKDLFMGSSTKAIVRAVSAPVLVVKTHQKEIKADKILIPTDLSKASKWHIHAVKTLFPKASLTLMHTYTVPFGNRASMYGVKKGDMNMLGENLHIQAENEMSLFLDSLGGEKEEIDTLVREGSLDAHLFTAAANMHGISMISLHTTGKISFFAFDLLQETSKDVLITTV